MENLNLALGVEEYKIAGGGVLRFNPTDPNIYASFLDSQKQLETIHKSFQKKAKTAKDGAAVLPVEGKRYIKTSLSRGEIEKIIQTALVISE